MNIVYNYALYIIHFTFKYYITYSYKEEKIKVITVLSYRTPFLFRLFLGIYNVVYLLIIIKWAGIVWLLYNLLYSTLYCEYFSCLSKCMDCGCLSCHQPMHHYLFLKLIIIRYQGCLQHVSSVMNASVDIFVAKSPCIYLKTRMYLFEKNCLVSSHVERFFFDMKFQITLKRKTKNSTPPQRHENSFHCLWFSLWL